MSAFDRPTVLSQVYGIEIGFIQKPISIEKLQEIVASQLGNNIVVTETGQFEVDIGKTSLTVDTNLHNVIGSRKNLS